MSNYNDVKLLIATYSGNERHITIPKVYLELTKDYPTAALLNQMIFWSDKTKRKDGFFYKTYKEWEEETFLSEYQVRRASKKLKELGFLETKLKKANGSPTLHYKLDMDALSESIVKKLKNRNQRNLSIDGEVPKESLTVDDTVDDNSRKDSPDSAKAKYDDESPYMKLVNQLEKHILSNSINGDDTGVFHNDTRSNQNDTRPNHNDTTIPEITTEITTETTTEKEHSPAKAEQIPYKEIIEHLNEKTGKNISYKSKGNRSLIKARWNEDYTLEDFKKVIDNKVADWFGTGVTFNNGKKAETYLHPSTLFRESNFDKYLNEDPASKGVNTKYNPSTDEDKYGWKDQIPT